MNRAIYPVLGGLMALGLMAVSHDADANPLFTFGTEFSGSGSSLSGPVTVEFIDTGLNSVDVKIDTSGLDGTNFTEKVTGLYLNLNPGLDPTNISVSFPGNNTTPHAGVSLGTDAFKADGDGLYDILISWDVSGTGRLLADMTDRIAFTLAGLTVADLTNYLSTPAGGHGPYYAALRAQSLDANGNGSGWFYPTRGFTPGGGTPVLEPGTLALFGVGLAGLGLAFRRRRARSH